MRTTVLTAMLLLAPLALSGALGNPEAGEYEPVAGLENWDHRLDIEGREAGKYNLILRATDRAGNVRYQGPYNLFVDPESDLPIVRISHPVAGTSTGALLNVVGTCIDDDGVKAVEVQLDDRQWMTVRGTEYWSLALDLTAIPDGEHVLRARAVDINDTEGHMHSVRFHLDKQAPEIRVTSHASGALVSGTVALEGTIQDANGVASLAISLDGGESHEPLKAVLDKPGTRGTFRAKIDTRDKPDGPLVVWLRGSDRTGSSAQHAFLLFVNNDPPELEILFPGEGFEANGTLLVAGSARDKVGLKSLSWELAGGQQGTIPLTPGNPYWTHEVDLSAAKAGALQISYTLENLTGNSRTGKLRIKVNPAADRPQLTLVSPQPGELVSGKVLVSGFLSDDDAVQGIEYALDGGQPVTVPTASAFSLALEEVAPGPHKLAVRPLDVNGVFGAAVEIAFSKAGAAPAISAVALVEGGSSSAFDPGMVFQGERDASLTGSLRSDGARIQAQYSLMGAPEKALPVKKTAEGQRAFELPLPGSLPPGRIDFSITLADELGGTAALSSFLFKGAEPESSGIVIADARLGTDGRIRLDQDPLVGFAYGGAVREAELEPASRLVRIQTEGSRFRLYPVAPGVGEPTRIRVTAADGSVHRSDPLRFVTDLAAPELTVQRPEAGDWVSTVLSLEGSVSDPSGVARLEYSLDAVDYTALEVEGEGGDHRFAAEVAVSFLEDGPHLLVLRGEDGAGIVSIAEVPFWKDSTAPVVSLIAPRPEDPVNGLVTIVGSALDAGRIALVEVSEDGSSFREVGRKPEFAFDVNLSRLPGEPGGLVIRCTDAAGNHTLLRPEMNLSLAADAPVVQIQFPQDGELVRTDFVLSGMVFDDDGVAAVYYRIDGGEFQSLPGGNTFSVPFSLAEIGDNEHTVEVKAEDLGGLESATAVSRFRVSTSEPVSTLESPPIDSHLRDVVELSGTSRDPNGIAEVRVSFDNGLSYFLTDGTDAWTYRLDTRLLADGTHALLVAAVDSTGARGVHTTTINVDNRAPELTLDAPEDGQILTDNLPLNGWAVDAVGISAVTLSLTPVSSSEEQAAATLQASLPPKDVLAENLDISELPPGWYNLRVEASDQAGNRSYVSRNFLKRASQEAQRVELMFPADGERLGGPFGISGRVFLDTPPGTNVVVFLDGQPLETAPVNSTGHFYLEAGPEKVSADTHTLQAQILLPGDLRLESATHRFEYRHSGPWLHITSFAPGDFVTGRPFLEGHAGYAGNEPESSDRGPAGPKAAPGTPKLQLVEVSLDNGRSFRKADGRQSWRYRLETHELPNGPLRVLVKAIFSNGEIAVTRTQLTVDTRPPEVALLEPSEGGRFNDAITLAGTSRDESGLQEIAVSLREGDKSRYQVPGFVQGLYLDLHTMGATYWDAGLGLTFFDDNVKLQLQVGMSPPGRFSGLVIGAKLLANIATLPFGYLFGPSWDFFSMSLAVGANFSYFTMSEEGVDFTAGGLVLGSVVAQLEFARFEIPRWRAFNAYSLYSEYQLWFISSDIEGGTVSRIAFGLRVGLL